METSAPTGRRRSKRLRSAIRTVRTGRPSATSREGNPDVLAMVDRPYESIEETVRRLEDLLASFEERDDRRAVFLTIYSMMTREVAERVRRGDFANPSWVGEYLVAFANHYREAVYDYEAGRLDSLADPWQLAFDAADRGDSLIVQDAALGVNAHINYDLAHALDDVGVQRDPETKYADHGAVTDVIERLVDDAQASLVERDADGIATLDESLGPLDEWLTVFTIDECRDSAWRTARAMHSRFRARRRLARWINDVTATGAAHFILSPSRTPFVHDTLEDLEQPSG